MASRFARTSIIQGQRGLAAQAAAAKKSDAVTGAKVQTTQLSNGLTVASMDTGAAISSVGFIVKTGSRNETNDNRGVNHALRLAAGLGTADNTSFSIVRSIQQAGGNMDVVSSREYTLYSSQVPRNNVRDVVDYLMGTVDSPVFKRWEVNDIVGRRMSADVANLSLAVVASELLHKAAFREGLGNSLYAPEYMVGKHKVAMLQDFHNKNYSADKSVLMGLDVDHDTLISFGEKFKLAKGGAASLPSKYHNGESRCECGGNQAFIALAAESAPATNVKEAVATMILQQVLGTGARVKRGNGQRQLQKATSSIGGEHSVSAINYTYSDAGLMGAFIASDAQSAGQVTGAVVAALRSVHVTEAELTAAKKSLQIYLDDQMHSPPAKLEAMAAHLAFGTKEAVTPSQMADLFTKASLSDVQAAAKKLANAKFSMGAAGNLGSLPFIDQL